MIAIGCGPDTQRFDNKKLKQTKKKTNSILRKMEKNKIFFSAKDVKLLRRT